MTGARHFAKHYERQREAGLREVRARALEEVRREREEEGTLVRREHPGDRHVCRVCAPEVLKPLHAADALEVLGDGLAVVRCSEPETCDACGRFGDAYVYRLRGALDAGGAHLGAGCGASEGPAPIPNLKRDVREWYDYGKDTGRRLRVKGLVDVDALPVAQPEPDPNGPDPREVEELHRQSREAMAEGDDRKLGKLYEDLLDALHSQDLPTEDDPITKARHDLRARELEAALGAELGELGRGRRWAVGYRLASNAAGSVELVVGVLDKASGAEWQITVDQRALYNAVRRAGAEMRMAAREIATRVRDHVDKARAGAVLGVA